MNKKNNQKFLGYGNNRKYTENSPFPWIVQIFPAWTLHSFYGQRICSVVVSKLKYEIVKEMATLWVICRHKNSTHFQNAPVLMKARSIYDVSNRP